VSEAGFRAMGTAWFLRAEGCAPAVLRKAQRRVTREERRFSRLDRRSALGRLNQDRTARDAVLASVVRDALAFASWTHGAFDPMPAAPGARLAPCAFEDGECPVPTPARPTVSVRGDEVRLLGSGTLDLGGIVKGWMVDEIARFLDDAGAEAYLVDGGGDVRVGMPMDALAWPLGAADGHVLRLRSRAVATASAPQGGCGGMSTHPLAAARRPAGGYVTATVVAPAAMTADVLGSALIAGGDAVLPALLQFGAEALLEREDGSRLMTPGLQGWMHP